MKTLKVLKVDQPIGEFYIGAINSQDLIEISTVEIRDFEEGHPDTIDGIQRQLSKSRLKELSEYVNLDYATFPTSIILAIHRHCVEIRPIIGCDGLFDLIINDWSGDDDTKAIPITESAFVIDGQHRLAGLTNRHSTKGPFELNVSIFVGADIADQAEIFSRVNLAQTKVNKSLMYDLLDYAKEHSPYKVAHDVVVAMNKDNSGPFYRKIKRLGIRTPGQENETLAQATVVDGLLRHLPKKQEKERTKSLFGWAGQAEPDENWRDRIFVDFYRKEDFVSIFLIVSNYFEAARRRWPSPWDTPEEGQILCRTTGYNALIRFLKEAYLYKITKPRIVEVDEFLEIFKMVQLNESDFTRDKFLPGSSGSGELYKLLCDSLKNKND
ncbi:DGQHR domain-containing protein [Nisaea sp.]|uniref:DGQHR domain-containing protein n=1 Tax=Nisaea sp. TaxID=2024842 RepID=UPI0032995B4E